MANRRLPQEEHKRSAFVVLLLLLSVSLLAVAVLIPVCHQVSQDSVGVYLRKGFVVGISDPGFRLKFPSTELMVIPFSIQTERVKDLQCVSNRNALLKIETIQVIFEVESGRIRDIISKCGPHFYNKCIKELVPSVLRRVCAKYSFTELNF